MKHLALAVAIAFGAGSAYADSLTVTPAAAMEGSYGLQVNHNNSSPAYVQDDTPSAETTYRFDFLFNAASVLPSPIGMNMRQEIVRAFSPNPHGHSNCNPFPAWIGAIRVWLYQTGGAGQNSNIQVWARGDWCGESGTIPRIPINTNQDYRVCVEWQTGSSMTGYVAVAVVNPSSSCPSSGDSAWVVKNLTNALTNIEFVRMGTPANNFFGAGETMTLYFDDFESFRSITP